MSNPHFDKAIKISKSAEGSGLEVHQAMYDIARAQMNATLALAFEARTANLISIHQMAVTALTNGFHAGTENQHNLTELATTIETRLGLGDTK